MQLYSDEPFDVRRSITFFTFGACYGSGLWYMICPSHISQQGDLIWLSSWPFHLQHDLRAVYFQIQTAVNSDFWCSYFSTGNYIAIFLMLVFIIFVHTFFRRLRSNAHCYTIHYFTWLKRLYTHRVPNLFPVIGASVMLGCCGMASGCFDRWTTRRWRLANVCVSFWCMSSVYGVWWRACTLAMHIADPPLRSSWHI